ncbi:MAG: hypothetical protein QOD12_814 [Verrucomicrobiota bacterium]|jgi:hypothetical protein
MNEAFAADVQHIDAIIKEFGFCLIKEEQLKLLFADEDSDSKRFVLLARLAHERAWSFEFQPHDGDVRIVSLSPIRTN